VQEMVGQQDEVQVLEVREQEGRRYLTTFENRTKPFVQPVNDYKTIARLIGAWYDHQHYLVLVTKEENMT